MIYKRFAFTLAEILITLAVVGVVSAITLPAIVNNINERIYSERQANIAQKVTQAMEQMRAHGLLNTQYVSTDAFVDELQKYLKIAKRCDASNIANCWPTKFVTDGNGNEFDVSNAKKRSALLMGKLGSNTDNVGLVFADGSSIILTYSNAAKNLDVGDKIEAINKDLPIGNKKSKNFPYTSDVTDSIDFVMDVNGAKGPNSETVNGKYHDIRSFNLAMFSKGCAGTKVDGIGCMVLLGQKYEASHDSVYTRAGYGTDDYYQGAIDACKNIGMNLVSSSVLDNLRSGAKWQKYPFLSKFLTMSFVWGEYNKEGQWGRYATNNFVKNKNVKMDVLCVGN